MLIDILFCFIYIEIYFLSIIMCHVYLIFGVCSSMIHAIMNYLNMWIFEDVMI